MFGFFLGCFFLSGESQEFMHWSFKIFLHVDCVGFLNHFRKCKHLSKLRCSICMSIACQVEHFLVSMHCLFTASVVCQLFRPETQQFPNVQPLIWSQQLFLFLLPPSTSLPPPSIFPMLFQLQTFRERGILSQHILSAYSAFHLPPASLCSFPSAKNSLKFKFVLLAQQAGNLWCWTKLHQLQTNIFIYLSPFPSQLLHLFICLFGSALICIAPFPPASLPLSVSCPHWSHLHHIPTFMIPLNSVSSPLNSV